MVVHVWTATVDIGPAALDMVARPLSLSERTKRDSFRFERDRIAYAFRHAMLRHVLGATIGVDPAHLEFATNAFGKPSLEGAQGRCPVSFNLSRSGDVVAVALAEGREVGIDIEHVRPMADLDTIARHWFTTAEYKHVTAAQPPRRCDRFFSVWTRKEAFIKAIGRGLSIPLTAFDVSPPAAALAFEGHSGALSDLTMPASYVGALAVSGPPSAIEYHEWRPCA